MAMLIMKTIGLAHAGIRLMRSTLMLTSLLNIAYGD